nr:hypothetical protein [Tanacetum cinerariifolium]
TIDIVKSILTQSALEALCEKYYIPDVVHHVLPSHNDRIRNSPLGTISVYSRMDLFAFITYADLTKVWIAEREGEHVIDVGGIDVVVDNEVQAIVADKRKRISHLPVEVGVTVTAIVPFVTSSVTYDSIFGTRLRTRHPAERFVISSESSHDLNVNVIDDEVTYVIRSSMPPPPELTAAIATTFTTGVTSTPVHGSGAGQAQHSIFRDFTSPNVVEADMNGPSQRVGKELLMRIFYVSQDMDPKTLRQVYIPKWNVINDSVLDDMDVCRGMSDRLAPLEFFSQLRGMDYEQLLAEFMLGPPIRNAEIASLMAQLSLKEAKATEAIHLCDQVVVVEATEAARANVELASSHAQVAKLTQDLSRLQLSCDELSVKASSLEFEKDILIDQVSALETACYGLCDEVMAYKLLKEQVEAMQDEQVKALGDRVAAIDSDLMEMALHIEEEFYPRWVIVRAIDKGMQDGLAASIDHRKARRGLVDVFACNPFAKADYVTAINALRIVDFPLLAQLESLKDARDAKAHRLSLTDVMVPLIEPLSAKSLIGETSASGVSAMVMTTALSTTFIQANTIPSVPSSEVPPSLKVLFEQEELDTTPEHTSAPNNCNCNIMYKDSLSYKSSPLVIVEGISLSQHPILASSSASDGTGKKKGRTVTLTADDMQKRKNDVKARTTLLLSLPDEHQLRFMEGSETLEQMFNRLQVIVSQLQFMDIEIEHDDLNQKFLTSLAPEWLMHMIVWRNMSDLDTMSLDDLYNHLKVYESEVQKKSEPNSQNMAFISFAKHSSGNEEVNIASGSTASINVSTASANIGVASISQDTACAYIASQSSGLAQVEARLAEHRNQELKYYEKIRILEFKTESRANCIESLTKDLELLKKEKGKLETKLTGFQTSSKDLDSLLESKIGQEQGGIRIQPSPAIESTSDDAQNRNPSEASPSTISPKSFIKFVKTNDSPTKRPNFMMKKKACFNCGNFDHLPYNCGLGVKMGRSSPKNNYTHRSMPPRLAVHKLYRPPIRAVRPNMNVAQPQRTSFHKPAHSYNKRPFQRTSAVRSQLSDPRVATVNRKFPTVNRKLPTVNRKFPTGNTKFSTADMGNKGKAGSSQNNIDDKGYWNSGCSRHMTCNISYLFYYEPFDEGYVSFGQGGCKFTSKGTIKTSKLKFENVYFVKDLKYNLFSVSQICDNKNSVLFTDSECIVLGRDFKPIDDTNMLLMTPRQHNMYSIDLNNIVPHKDLTCLVAKASADECMLWHMRLGHLNFKTMNRLVRHNLVRGLPSKCFENNHTCTACLKGKKHKASCKSKLVNFVTKPLHTLHIDLFGLTSVSSISHKWYCLVVTDDFSRFTWTFFLKSKDETSGILRKFITEIENLKDLKVKIIRCHNRGEFRNKELNDFFHRKGSKESLAMLGLLSRMNGVAKRRNKTLIEVARTMVLVNKSQNKTLYELFNGRTPAIGFLKPFGCHVMILNTLDNLGKFKTKGDEDFLENKAIEKGAGPNWLFDIDSLTKSMNYVPVVVAGTNSTNFSGTKDAAIQEPQETCNSDEPKSSGNSNLTATSTNPLVDQLETLTVETPIPTISSPVPTACLNDYPEPSSDTRLISKRFANQVETPSLNNILTMTNRFKDILGVTTNSKESNGVEADVSNIEKTITARPTPTFRIHKDHPKNPSWVEAMQEELLQFKIQKVWTLVDCPKGVRPIGTKWVLKNKKDKRGIVIKNKARLVAQGHTQEEGIDYDEPPGFQDPEFPARVYKVEKAMSRLHQAPRAWYNVKSSNTPMDKENPWGKTELEKM